MADCVEAGTSDPGRTKRVITRHHDVIAPLDVGPCPFENIQRAACEIGSVAKRLERERKLKDGVRSSRISKGDHPGSRT